MPDDDTTMTIYLSKGERKIALSVSLDGQDPPKPGSNVMVEGDPWTVAGVEIEVPWRMQKVARSEDDLREEGGN